MGVVPVGVLVRIVVTSLLAEGEETGEVWRELSIGVPTEE